MMSYLPFPPTLPPGFKFQKYTVQHYVAHGSDTINYLIEDSKGRKKILKECFPHASSAINVQEPYALRSNTGEVSISSQLKDRFKFGAEIFVELNHPYMMNIDEIIEGYGTVYVIGEYVDGYTIFDYPKEITDSMMENIIDCINAIHEIGCVLKGPSTKDVMVDKKGRIRIVDFSSVRRLSPEFHPSRDFKIIHRLLNRMQYRVFPSSIRKGVIIHGCEILDIVGDGSDCIAYKVKESNRIKILKEFFPHMKSPQGGSIEPGAYRFNNGRIYFSRQLGPRKIIYENGAKVFQQVEHPVLMDVEEIFFLYNTCYVLGEYVEGLKLFPYKFKYNPSREEWVRIFKTVLEGLKALHEQGWIQGDVSSSNILMQDRQPRIVDFSSVKKSSEEHPPESDYRKLGRLILKLADCSQDDLEDRPKEWIERFLNL